MAARPHEAVLSALFHPAVFPPDNESALVQAFFGSRQGVFVEVGAFDPVVLSQTAHLERNGWRGVLVEPLTEYAARLRQERSATVFAVAAGSPEADGKTLPMVVAGALSTLAPRGALAANERRWVPIRTLDSILLEAGLSKLDFLSIDTEGTEIDVLRGLSLEKYQPSLVLLEDEVHSLAKHRYMNGKGYRLFRRTGFNNWYVPLGTQVHISVFGRWQLYRKMRLGTPLRRWRRSAARKAR